MGSTACKMLPATELLQKLLRRLSVEAVVELRVRCGGAGVHFNRHLGLGYRVQIREKLRYNFCTREQEIYTCLITPIMIE